MGERSWKLFCLLLFLLLRRVVNKFSVTVEEFCRRFELFGAGTWDAFVDEAVASNPRARPTARRLGTIEDWGKAACQKAQVEPVSASLEWDPLLVAMKRSTKFFSKKKKKRPHEIQLELPEDVRAFVPESPLVHDLDAFMQSLQTIHSWFISRSRECAYSLLPDKRRGVKKSDRRRVWDCVERRGLPRKRRDPEGRSVWAFRVKPRTGWI